jgi:threonine/homoserine/homoserine lactone efflux protein
MEMKAKLSTLWLFVLLNIIFRDIHELFRVGMLEEMMAGIVNGNQITEVLLLVGGIIIEVPIAMVLLSRLLKDNINRWANIVAGVFTIGSVIFAGPADLDDMFFAAIEILSLALIIWFAWTWRSPRRAMNVES